MKRCSSVRGMKWVAIVGSLLLALGLSAFSVVPAAAQTRAASSVRTAPTIQQQVALAPAISARFIRFLGVSGPPYNRHYAASVYITGRGFRPYERVAVSAYLPGHIVSVTPRVMYADRNGRIGAAVSVRFVDRHRSIRIMANASYRWAATGVYIP